MQAIHSVLLFVSGGDDGLRQGQPLPQPQPQPQPRIQAQAEGNATTREDATKVQLLPQRREWLGDFGKVRISGGQTNRWGGGTDTAATAKVTLSLDRDAFQRWIPAGASATVSFINGRYTVQKGVYMLRLTDGATTATLSVV